MLAKLMKDFRPILEVFQVKHPYKIARRMKKNIQGFESTCCVFAG